MNEARMLAELAKLPDAELLQASKITDPVGADVYYSGRTVVRLLAHKQAWQPIETAPKDETDILVYGSGSYAVARWDGQEWRDMGDIGWAGMDGSDGNQPTHWLPLTPPC